MSRSLPAWSRILIPLWYNKHWFSTQIKHSIMSITLRLTTKRCPIQSQVSNPWPSQHHSSVTLSWASLNTATLVENTIVLVHHSNGYRQGRQPRGQTRLEPTHLDPDARQQLTAKTTTLIFRIQSIILLAVLIRRRRLGRTTDESTCVHTSCCYVKTVKYHTSIVWRPKCPFPPSRRQTSVFTVNRAVQKLNLVVVRIVCTCLHTCMQHTTCTGTTRSSENHTVLQISPRVLWKKWEFVKLLLL